MKRQGQIRNRNLLIDVEEQQDTENFRELGKNSPHGPTTGNQTFKFSQVPRGKSINNLQHAKLSERKSSQRQILQPYNKDNVATVAKPRQLGSGLFSNQKQTLIRKSQTTTHKRDSRIHSERVTPRASAASSPIHYNQKAATPKARPTESINNIVTANTQTKAMGEKAYKDHLFNTFQSMKFVRHGLSEADEGQIKEKMVYLPKRSAYRRKKTVVFDLDETLVHCEQDLSQAQMCLDITFPSGATAKAGINIRPYAKECLMEANKHFEVIVFTASHSWYADRVLDFLDPHKDLIHHRLYRENCIFTDGVYLKDLRILANRRMQDIVIVDNNAYSFGYQLDNGIPIISWYNDANDRELFNLVDYLKVLSLAKDIRLVNRHTFRLHRFYEDFIKDYGDCVTPNKESN